jgi:hypothetical protein
MGMGVSVGLSVGGISAKVAVKVAAGGNVTGTSGVGVNVAGGNEVAVAVAVGDKVETGLIKLVGNGVGGEATPSGGEANSINPMQ